MEDEVSIAAAKKVLDPNTAADYLIKLEKSSSTLIDALHRQNERAAVCLSDLAIFNEDANGMQEVKWDQEEFEKRLAEWIVVCDQSFDEVDKPEF